MRSPSTAVPLPAHLWLVDAMRRARLDIADKAQQRQQEHEEQASQAALAKEVRALRAVVERLVQRVGNGEPVQADDDRQQQEVGEVEPPRELPRNVRAPDWRHLVATGVIRPLDYSDPSVSRALDALYELHLNHARRLGHQL